MKIYVCLKRVPNTATRIRVAPDGRSIDSAGVKFVTSPYDEFSLEAALRVRDAAGEGEVVALSLGGDEVRETLRGALAMGADRAILLLGETAGDGLATAKALASELEGEDPDLILVGVKAVDGDGQQVGPMLATLLGRACVTVVSEFSVEGGGVTCIREVAGGKQTVRVPRGSVLTITKGVYEPRHPSLTGIMAAKKKPIEERTGSVPAPRVTRDRLELPPERPGGRVIGNGAEAVPELVRVLREEAGAI